MELTDFETAMLGGEFGVPKRIALEQQISVGNFFDAQRMVKVEQAHIMGDTESLGESGVAFFEELARYPLEERQVAVPTITDPRGVDACRYSDLRQKLEWAELEGRVTAAMRKLGILMTDTCINYQSVQAPVYGQHLAFGDTGVVIYSNSVCGARSNFEGGPSALAASLTGRTPCYGYHLDRNRLGTQLYEINFEPETLSDWGALGAVIGRKSGSYWAVPVLDNLKAQPNSDALKHFGAAMASYGSVALFHILGCTPEARAIRDVFPDTVPSTVEAIGKADIEQYLGEFKGVGKIDVVVFAAPQLSLFEIQMISGVLKGSTVCATTDLIICTNPEIKSACDRMGITEILEAAGAIVLSGVCFYQMYAREMAIANNWKTLLTNSAKLCNIISGYGYKPSIAPIEECVSAAIDGEI